VKRWDFNAGTGKIELTLKSYRATWAVVDRQWTDAARREFEETYLSVVEPNVKGLLDAVAALAEVLTAAERQCGDE
jgi:hypothetical protein